MALSPLLFDKRSLLSAERASERAASGSLPPPPTGEEETERDISAAGEGISIDRKVYGKNPEFMPR